MIAAAGAREGFGPAANEDSAGGDAALPGERAAYYRARAGEYDEWRRREGRYDHGPEAAALKPGGRAFFVDSLPDGTSGARPLNAR